jgi:hypothetical protein
VPAVKKADELELPFPYKRKVGENTISKKEVCKYLKKFLLSFIF